LILGRGKRFYLFFKVYGMALGSTQPPVQWIPRNVFLGVKQPGHETDHSSPSRAKVKNEHSYISVTIYTFMACRRITLPLSLTENVSWNDVKVE
jgi:hypothetical protein